MNHESMILNIKASMFNFHDLFNHESNDAKMMMEMFHERMKNILIADQATIFLNRNKLAYFLSNRQIVSMQSVINTDVEPYQRLKRLFPSDDDNVVLINSDLNIAQHDQPFHIVMRLRTATNFSGFYVFSYNENPGYPLEALEDIQELIDKHFLFISNHLREKFMKERNQLLFQLSANLHSIHSTPEVLIKVYRTIKRIYPRFDYRFLMSHEHENNSAPIYTLSYAEKKNAPETVAFINNEMQFDFDEAENVTLIYSPLSGKQGVYGVIEIKIPGQVYLDVDDIAFVEQSSKMIGQAVERTTLYQSSNQLVTDLQFINIASRDLNKNLDRRQISQSVKKHIVTSCQAEELGIVLFPRNEETEKRFIVSEESTGFFRSNKAERFIEYLYETLKEKPEPILSGNFKADSVVIPFNSVIVVPMWDSEKMFGFIVIAHEEPYYFSFDKYKFVQSFIQHAALAYTNSMLKEKLRLTAITDYLTKLYLRNHLDKKIDEHMKKDRGGSFILLDVDDFKLINDTYGHYVGDKVLIQIAEIIKETVNDNEIAARWGGEEFAIYVPYANEEYALTIANRIREKVEEKTDPKVTLSIGISSWYGDNESIEQLFNKADEALYEAKASGKNRIVMN